MGTRSENAVNNSINNLLTSVIKYPIIIATGIIVTRFLGPESKGIYVYLGMMGSVIVPILFFGLGAGIQYYLSNERFSPKETATTITSVGLFVGAIVAIGVYLIWSLELLGESGNAASHKIILAFVFALPFEGINHSIRFLLTGDSKFKLLNFYYLFNALSCFAFLTIAVFYHDDKLLAAAYTLNLIKIVLAIFIFVHIYRKYLPIWRFNLPFLKITFIYGIKSWIGDLSGRANDMLDQFIVGSFLSASELGIYSISYAYVKLLYIPANSISSILFNEISFKNDLTSSLKNAVQVHKALLLVTLILAIPMVLLGKWLIVTLYGIDFEGAYLPFLILLPGIIIYTVSRRVLNKALAANGHPLKTSTIELTSAFVGVVLYWFLVPQYGLIGGAIGSTIAYFVSGVVAYKLVYDLNGGHFGFFAYSKSDLIWMKEKLQLMSIKKFIK